MNVMDDWKLKTAPVVRMRRPMFVYILLLGVINSCTFSCHGSLVFHYCC